MGARGPKPGATYKRTADKVSAVRTSLSWSIAQDRAYRAAAKRKGVSLGAWIRDRLDRAVETEGDSSGGAET